MAADLTYTDFVTELLNDALGGPPPAPDPAEVDRANMRALGYAPWQGRGIATKGCPKCRGTMKRTEERGGGGQWICSNVKCGYVE